MKHVEETCRRDSPGPLARGPGSARTPRRSHLGGVTHPVSRCGCLRPPRSDWRHPRGARWRKLGGLPTQGHSLSRRQQQCLSKICTQQFSVLARWVHFCSRPPGGGGRTQGHGHGAQSEDSVGRTGAPTLATGSPPRREARILRGRDPSARPHCAPSCQRPGLSRAARLRARPAVPGHSVHGRGGLGLWRELGFLSASRTVHQLMNGEPWLQTHHAAEGHKGHVRPGPDAPTWPDPPPPTGH